MRAMDRRTAVSFGTALTVLVTLAVLGSEPPRDASRHDEYFQRVSEAISAIPYRIVAQATGDTAWIGADAEAQAPAIRLLRPNKLLQRRYVSQDGTATFSLLFIHCTDARDMQGHYPPVCYPAHGWTIDRATQTDFILGPSRAPCTVYHLSALRHGRTMTMTILNFFAVPWVSESLSANMSSVNRAALSSSRSWIGAAQIQVIVSDDVSEEHMTSLMRQIAPAIEPAIREVIDGQRTTTPGVR